MAQWQRERPDLDLAPVQVLGRLSRIGPQLDRALAMVFERFGLGPGEFDVLATLRRAGAPFELTPSALMDSMVITSGAVTKRVDRLVAEGLVQRRPDPADGRGKLVGLTTRGREVVDAAIGEHLANEDRLLGLLTARQREQLADLLRLLDASFRAAHPDRDAITAG